MIKNHIIHLVLLLILILLSFIFIGLLNVHRNLAIIKYYFLLIFFFKFKLLKYKILLNNN